VLLCQESPQTLSSPST